MYLITARKTPIIWRSSSRSEKLRLNKALAPYKHIIIGVLKMANLLSG